MTDAALVDWLLDSDTALRWQVERDLLHEPEEVWGATRARVWSGGAFFPKDVVEAGPDASQEPGQPWTATTWPLRAPRTSTAPW